MIYQKQKIVLKKMTFKCCFQNTIVLVIKVGVYVGTWSTHSSNINWFLFESYLCVSFGAYSFINSKLKSIHKIKKIQNLPYGVWIKSIIIVVRGVFLYN